MKTTQVIRTELVIRNDSKTTNLINSICKLQRQNQRLALERSIFVVAFAVVLAVLACILFMNTR